MTVCPSQPEDENVGAGPRACPNVAARLGRTQGSAPTIIFNLRQRFSEESPRPARLAQQEEENLFPL
jgi:hypothetical protein